MKVHKFPVHTKMLLCNPDFAFYVELVNVTFIIIYILKTYINKVRTRKNTLKNMKVNTKITLTK